MGRTCRSTEYYVLWDPFLPHTFSLSDTRVWSENVPYVVLVGFLKNNGMLKHHQRKIVIMIINYDPFSTLNGPRVKGDDVHSGFQ